jgi:mitotic spindle assembly checkpoint protein MAD2
MFARAADWLSAGTVQKLVLVISSQESGETLERWVFDLQTDKSIGPNDRVDKSDKEVQAEIAAIMRQITASVTFLPLNDEPCAFDLLVYTDEDVQVPTQWENSDPKLINNADEVKLRSFTTKVHKVDASVSYRADA